MCKERGFTLIELVTVTAILVVVASVALLNLSSTSEEEKVHAAQVSLTALRDAIVGTLDRPGFIVDNSEPPIRLSDLFQMPTLLPSGRPVHAFDRFTARGWNGPYLASPGGVYALNDAAGFTINYDNVGAPCVIDPWQRPVILQRPTTTGLTDDERREFTRLVSAGPDGIIETSPSAQAPDRNQLQDVGDDIVLYLFRANGP